MDEFFFYSGAMLVGTLPLIVVICWEADVTRQQIAAAGHILLSINDTLEDR